MSFLSFSSTKAELSGSYFGDLIHMFDKFRALSFFEIAVVGNLLGEMINSLEPSLHFRFAFLVLVDNWFALRYIFGRMLVYRLHFVSKTLVCCLYSE